MTQWEQLKKEYKEINVPEQGKHMVLEAMAEAKKKRSRWKELARYGSVAAAVLLVLLLPGMMLFSGGMKSAKNDSAYMEMDSAPQNAADVRTETGFKNNSSYMADGGYAYEEPENLKADAADTESQTHKPETATGEAAGQETVASWVAYKEEISNEIIRQMQEDMQMREATYFVKSEAYPEGFGVLNEDQPFYYTPAGELVIVFGAGEVAPEAMGEIEFVIPKEIYTP